MTKVRSLRSTAVLMIATLMTTCLVGGTFAKYTTTVKGETEARVAYWGFNGVSTIDMSDLFATSYTNVSSSDTSAVIAPGTSGSMTFSFPYDETNSEAPEVKYQFKITVTATAPEAVTNDPNIQFALDNGSWTTLSGLKDALLALSGSSTGVQSYEAGTLPTAFTEDDDTHTIKWQWLFQPSSLMYLTEYDALDTALGNASGSQDINLSLTVAAHQID